MSFFDLNDLTPEEIDEMEQMTSLPADGKVCASCIYSRSKKVIDPILSTVHIPDGVKGLGSERIETKCHIQGKPQVVNADTDWCFSYFPKTCGEK